MTKKIKETPFKTIVPKRANQSLRPADVQHKKPSIKDKVSVSFIGIDKIQAQFRGYRVRQKIKEIQEIQLQELIERIGMRMVNLEERQEMRNYIRRRLKNNREDTSMMGYSKEWYIILDKFIEELIRVGDVENIKEWKKARVNLTYTNYQHTYWERPKQKQKTDNEIVEQMIQYQQMSHDTSPRSTVNTKKSQTTFTEQINGIIRKKKEKIKLYREKEEKEIIEKRNNFYKNYYYRALYGVGKTVG